MSQSLWCKALAMRLAILAALGALCTTQTLRAQASEPAAPPQVQFDWVRGVGADACITRGQLEEDVAQRLGRFPFGAPSAQQIEGIVTRDGERWVAHLLTRDSGGVLVGQRTFVEEGAECGALNEVLGLALALAIDPEFVPAPEREVLEAEEPAESLPAAPEPELGGESTPEAAEAAPDVDGRDVPAQEAPAPDAWRGRAQFGAAVYGNLVPGASLAFEGHVEFRFVPSGLFSARVGGLFAPESETAGDARFGFALASALAGVCARSQVTALLEIGGCVDGLLGSQIAVVHSPTPVDAGGKLWGAVRASVSLGFRFTRGFGISLHGHGLVPIERRQYRVVGSSEIDFQQSIFIGGGEIALSAYFF